MGLSWGSVWWGRAWRRAPGLKRIGRRVGPGPWGLGFQLSLGVWHCYLVVWLG
jgi:hypothetical protein